jgi:hypothetical protein
MNRSLRIWKTSITKIYKITNLKREVSSRGHIPTKNFTIIAMAYKCEEMRIMMGMMNIIQVEACLTNEVRNNIIAKFETKSCRIIHNLQCFHLLGWIKILKRDVLKT